MAEKGCSRMPVLERATRQFLGLVSLNDLLKARSRHLEEERRRERTLKFRLFPAGRSHPEDRIGSSLFALLIGLPSAITFLDIRGWASSDAGSLSLASVHP